MANDVIKPDGGAIAPVSDGPLKYVLANRGEKRMIDTCVDGKVVKKEKIVHQIQVVYGPRGEDIRLAPPPHDQHGNITGPVHCVTGEYYRKQAGHPTQGLSRLTVEAYIDESSGRKDFHVVQHHHDGLVRAPDGSLINSSAVTASAHTDKLAELHAANVKLLAEIDSLKKAAVVSKAARPDGNK